MRVAVFGLVAADRPEHSFRDLLKLKYLRSNSSSREVGGSSSSTGKAVALELAGAAIAMGDHQASSIRRSLPVAFVLDGLYRPANVGSIFLTANALGAAGGVWTSGSTPVPPEENVLLAMVDSQSGECIDGKVPHVQVPSTAEAIANLRSSGVAVFAVDTGEGAVTLEEALDTHFAAAVHCPPKAIALVMVTLLPLQMKPEIITHVAHCAGSC